MSSGSWNVVPVGLTRTRDTPEVLLFGGKGFNTGSSRTAVVHIRRNRTYTVQIFTGNHECSGESVGEATRSPGTKTLAGR